MRSRCVVSNDRQYNIETYYALASHHSINKIIIQLVGYLFYLFGDAGPMRGFI